jgi:hypothetical protein
MSVLDIFASKWQLVLVLVSALAFGLALGQILFALNKEKAFSLLDWLDTKRKPFIRILYRLLYQPHGIVKAIAFIFVVNLFGASLFHHTIGGLLIIPPFLLLFAGGLLVSLIVRRYPERLLITVVVVPFEFGAFVVAATGGVSIGVSLWSSGEVVLAIREWAILFSTMVIPLQFLNAFWGGILAHRLFVIQGNPWPQWLFDERV